MSDQFNWFGPEKNSSIVAEPAYGVAVYTNQDGDIVIRQQEPMDDEDAVIIIPRALARAVAWAITDEAKKKR